MVDVLMADRRLSLLAGGGNARVVRADACTALLAGPRRARPLVADEAVVLGTGAPAMAVVLADPAWVSWDAWTYPSVLPAAPYITLTLTMNRDTKLAARLNHRTVGNVVMAETGGYAVAHVWFEFALPLTAGGKWFSLYCTPTTPPDPGTPWAEQLIGANLIWVPAAGSAPWHGSGVHP